MRTMKDKTDKELETPDPKNPSGLLLSGQVLARKRRKIELKDGSFRWCITLCILGGGVLHTCDTWSPTPIPPDLPDVGQTLTMPVRQKIFTSKSGGTIVKLEFGQSGGEEDF